MSLNTSLGVSAAGDSAELSRASAARDTRNRELLAISTIILEVVSTASKLAIEIQQSGQLDIVTKSDGSLQTRGDRELDLLLREELSKRLYLPIISEECLPGMSYQHRQQAQRFLLIDPIDGTSQYAAGMPEFTINVALLENGVPVLGVIGVPAEDKILFAISGLGAFCQQGDSANVLPRRVVADPTNICCRNSWREHESPLLEAFARENGITKMEKFATAIGRVRLIEGAIDVLPVIGNCSEWDVAAAVPIMAEVGCIFRSIETGEPLAFNKPILAVPKHLAFVEGLNLNTRALLG